MTERGLHCWPPPAASLREVSTRTKKKPEVNERTQACSHFVVDAEMVCAIRFEIETGCAECASDDGEDHERFQREHCSASSSEGREEEMKLR